jgi:hypothetical protein
MRVKLTQDYDQVLADVILDCGVELLFVKKNDSEAWEVWAVKIDGTTYREPRDLVGEPLQSGPFQAKLDAECNNWRRANDWYNANEGKGV